MIESGKQVSRSEDNENPWDWLRRTRILAIAEARWKHNTTARQRAHLKKS